MTDAQLLMMMQYLSNHTFTLDRKGDRVTLWIGAGFPPEPVVEYALLSEENRNPAYPGLVIGTSVRVCLSAAFHMLLDKSRRDDVPLHHTLRGLPPDK